MYEDEGNPKEHAMLTTSAHWRDLQDKMQKFLKELDAGRRPSDELIDGIHCDASALRQSVEQLSTREGAAQTGARTDFSDEQEWVDSIVRELVNDEKLSEEDAKDLVEIEIEGSSDETVSKRAEIYVKLPRAVLKKEELMDAIREDIDNDFFNFFGSSLEEVDGNVDATDITFTELEPEEPCPDS